MSKRGRERKPLLILDIAGVLIDGTAMTSKRNGLDEFLLMVFQNYHVVSWTSRNRYKEKKGRLIPAGESRTKHAFHMFRHRLVAEFYGEDTTPTSLMNDWKPLCLKDIDRVLEHPSVRELDVGKADVVVVDDSPVKWALHDDVRCFHPPTWSKDMANDYELDQGGRIFDALRIDKSGVECGVECGVEKQEFWNTLQTDEVVMAIGGVGAIRSSVIV